MTAVYPLPEDPIVGEVEAFCTSASLARRYAELDRHPAFPWTEYRGMGAAGLLGFSMHPAFGGRGLPLPRVGVVLYRLAYTAGTAFAKIALQPEFTSVLADHGNSSLVDEWYRPLVRGERLVGNQVTEPVAGSDAQSIECRAERTRTGYCISGTKSEVAFTEDAQAAIVYARVPTQDGRGKISAFLVPQDLPGVQRLSGVGDLGERWQRRGSVVYDQVEIPAEQRLGEEGQAFRYVVHELTRERALLAAIYLGVARASLDATVEYVGTRTTFGRPLSAHEGVAFPLVEDAGRIEAAWLLVEDALAALERSEPTAAARAALAKWMSGEVALTALDHAIQFHGGRGYSQSLPHEQRWRDVRSGQIAHGTSEVMHLVAGRELWPSTRPPSSGETPHHEEPGRPESATR